MQIRLDGTECPRCSGEMHTGAANNLESSIELISRTPWRFATTPNLRSASNRLLSPCSMSEYPCTCSLRDLIAWAVKPRGRLVRPSFLGKPNLDGCGQTLKLLAHTRPRFPVLDHIVPGRPVADEPAYDNTPPPLSDRRASRDRNDVSVARQRMLFSLSFKIYIIKGRQGSIVRRSPCPASPRPSNALATSTRPRVPTSATDLYLQPCRRRHPCRQPRLFMQRQRSLEARRS